MTITLYTLFISNSLQCQSEVFFTELEAITRWVDSLACDDDEAEILLELHAKHGHITGDFCDAMRIREHITDLYILDEHDLEVPEHAIN